MRTVLHRTPVVVYIPGVDRHVALKRGDELADNDPVCQDPSLRWLFQDSPEPAELSSVPVEQATRAPGERRLTRRR